MVLPAEEAVTMAEAKKKPEPPVNETGMEGKHCKYRFNDENKTGTIMCYSSSGDSVWIARDDNPEVWDLAECRFVDLTETVTA